MSQQNQFNKPSWQSSRLFIVLLVSALIGWGVFVYQYLQIREELQEQTKQVENLLDQIDRLEKRIY